MGRTITLRGITIIDRSPDELAELQDTIRTLRTRIARNTTPDRESAVSNLIRLEREYARSAAQ